MSKKCVIRWLGFLFLCTGLQNCAISSKSVITQVAAPKPINAVFFNLLQPTANQVQTKLSLWATYYRIHVAKHVTQGVDLVDTHNQPLGPKLSSADWCEAALEGTVMIKINDQPVVYNYADHQGKTFTNCKKFFPRFKSNLVTSMNKTRFIQSDWPYGYGVKDWLLQPYRTIAVDPKVIPYGSVIFIPKARGTKIQLPDGTTPTHDGYFYAGDRGGAIKDNHIDVFAGFYQDNPFPLFITNSKNTPFKAYIIQNVMIQKELEGLHQEQ